jgi:hypothetical protein
MLGREKWRRILRNPQRESWQSLHKHQRQWKKLSHCGVGKPITQPSLSSDSGDFIFE